MKTLPQLEAWALGVVDAVARKVRPEDDRVELKRDWPKDHNAAARRIAGHANQAAAEQILWVFGLDEKQGVQPLSSVDFGAWWSQVDAQFEGVAPTPQALRVPVPQGGEVYAVAFDTRRLPFVVKNGAGGGITYEVPWREGTLLRSARRAELLGILAPHIEAPVVDIIDGSITFPIRESGDMARLGIHLYFAPKTQGRLVFPTYKLDGHVVIWGDGGTEKPRPLWEPKLGPQKNHNGIPMSYAPIQEGEHEVIVDGPGLAVLNAQFKATPYPGGDEHIRAIVKLMAVNQRAPITVDVEFACTKRVIQAHNADRVLWLSTGFGQEIETG
jgi:hypothetical protein